MLRIIGGTFRSRQLETPDTLITKPTMDRVRAGVFSALNNDIYNKDILDLFAGSGSYGFESLSRGANKVTFIEKNDQPFRCIQRNAMKLDVMTNIDIIKDDVLNYLNNTNQKFDLIFADPPYKLDVYQDIIKIVYEHDLLNDHGILVLESENSLNIVSHPYFNKIKEYKYGLARVLILRR